MLSAQIFNEINGLSRKWKLQKFIWPSSTAQQNNVPVYTSVFFYIFVFILQLEGMSIFICLSKTGLSSEYFVIKTFDNFWRKKCCPQGRRGEILYTGSCFSPDPSALIGCQVATLSNHHHIISSQAGLRADGSGRERSPGWGVALAATSPQSGARTLRILQENSIDFITGAGE